MSSNFTFTSFELEAISTRDPSPPSDSHLAWNDTIPVLFMSIFVMYCAIQWLYALCCTKSTTPVISADNDHRTVVVSMVSDPKLRAGTKFQNEVLC